VLLVPANEAPHRAIEPEPGADVRLQMTTLAVADNGAFGASDVETSREGQSFTYRTLELLTEDRPGDEFWFVMGADVAAGLEGWREPGRVLELARLAIAARPGTELDEAEAALERLSGSERADLVRMPEVAVSSTRIRRRIPQGRPIRYLVPDAVREFIDQRGLYRA
jgi:nicotinate-nucleotide adenylyltransferase